MVSEYRSLNIELQVGWFYVMESKKVQKDRLYSQTIAGEKLLVFREESGAVAVTSARCAHFGADLSLGSLKDGKVTCPFHGWAYNAQGRCEEAPGESVIPHFAKLQTFPVSERYGSVFVFRGPKEFESEIPAFPGETEIENYIVSAPIKVEIDAPWYMAGMNEFDMRHFEIVHRRKVLGNPVVHFGEDGIAYTDLQLQNTGRTIMNRMMKKFFGSDVRLQIYNLYGMMKLAKTTIGPLSNRMVISIIPGEKNVSSAMIKVITPLPDKVWRIPLSYLKLFLMKQLSRAFFEEETKEIKGAEYSRLRATAKDRYVTMFMNWIARIQSGVAQATPPIDIKEERLQRFQTSLDSQAMSPPS